ncbi:hypothetical protein NT6N_04350 [Oceaniferula spumae]|uniref:Ankyrin repeat domain-containing protein n=1 Tax=Oceaniferula spumae TaxID=2979115 RepID=A0AAT9FHG1_9BACT
MDAERAIRNNDVESLEALVNAHPELVTEESGFDGHTLLFTALVNRPSYDCAKFLLDNGADPNHVDVTGETPLSTLHDFSGDTQCEELLLAYGANPPNKRSSSPTSQNKKAAEQGRAHQSTTRPESKSE